MEIINDVYGCNPCPCQKRKEHGKVGGNATFKINDY
jgi:hypothetical protein